MPIRIYRLTSASTVTATGQASTVIVAKGKIKQAVLTAGVVSGAAQGRISYEAALNNTSNGNSETATGAPSENLIARMQIPLNGSAPVGGQALVVPCDIPVIPGNNVCINVLASGTAPASANMGVDLHVME